MMLKRLVLGAGITLVALNLTGCFGGNKYAEYKDAEWYSIYKAFYHANELVGSEFNSEREDVIDEMEDMTEGKPNFVAVKRNNDGSISRTIDSNSRLLYVGEWDDKKPDGVGTLYYISNYTGEPFPSYMGEWEDGKYNGYGCVFEAKTVAHKTGPRKIDVVFEEVPVLRYEGYFEENKEYGKGIFYGIWENSYQLSYGDHKGSVLITGEGKKFINGVLRYEGEMKSSSYHGKGKEYYDNGELKYKGEFEDGEYHGDGILYDENGKEVYDGEFVKGNFK